jgi:alkylated DNA repair dioxygenase AlkB
VTVQGVLFGFDAPRLDPRFGGARRLELERGAWIEHVPGWLTGHQVLFDTLRDGVRWRSGQREMYGSVVDVPRLLARFPDDGEAPPLLREGVDLLSARYGKRVDRVSAAFYRDGRDSVAWHGDRVGTLLHDTVVAVLGLGHPRRFLLRPKGGGGRSLGFDLGWGDLLVMGGSCQATWEHCVPKVARADARISVMFREPVPPDPRAPTNLDPR